MERLISEMTYVLSEMLILVLTIYLLPVCHMLVLIIQLFITCVYYPRLPVSLSVNHEWMLVFHEFGP